MQVFAVEGGGTRTAAGLYSPEGALLAEGAGGPCNPIAYGIEHCARELIALMRQVRAGHEDFMAVLALAGAGNAAHDRALCDRLFLACPRLRRVWIGGDLQPVLHANAGTEPAMMVIAGTGSSVVAQDGLGRQQSAGGRGILLGDEGSGYALAEEALRAASRAHDGAGPATALLDALTAAAGLERFLDFVVWHTAASKGDIAALAKPVVESAEHGDAIAAEIVAGQADRLAALVAALQARVGLPAGTPLYLHGGMFRLFPAYRAVFLEALRNRECTLDPRDPAVTGHAAVARAAALGSAPPWLRACEPCGAPAGRGPEAVRPGPTLDALDAAGIAEALSEADAEAVAAVARARGAIAGAIGCAAAALRAGGRIVYVGAGTSGRLGVLDASECPPTFGVDPARVAGVIAGGERALRESVEGAEDDAAAGARDMAALDLAPCDFVVGIAASGTTPYTLGALAEARARGAATAMLSCNPAAAAEADVHIVLDTGPEALAGSTRLKAGTATKCALNAISTGAMALSGHVYRGLMVRMRPGNHKLRRRALRIIEAVAGADLDRAAHALHAAGNDLALAIVMAAHDLDAPAARARLDAAGNDLRTALEGKHP